MSPTISSTPFTETMYLVYTLLSIAITVWVARTLFRNGRVFLVDSFLGNQPLADSVNRLLVVGFYLVNLGFVSMFLRYGDKPTSWLEAMESLSWKVGIVLFVLGGMHFMNILIFSKARSRALLRNAPPPVEPDATVVV
ncbi:MAG TPA: hypothetical protein VHC70_10255 [Phycisphaerales bacterium]|jgi:hypothetical protein|nr:hypothetical protein [Phycisphaerales bacterium]